MRLIASVVALFLLLSTVEAGGFWLLGRWYVSSRYVSVSLQTVRNWLDRGIINRSTEWAKIAINRYGKWIILTIGLSQIIREIEQMETSTQYCYVLLPFPQNYVWSQWTSWGTLSIHHAGNSPSRFYEVGYSSVCRESQSLYLPAVEIREWKFSWRKQRYEWVWDARVPAPGTYTYTCRDGSRVDVTITLKVSRVCPSDVTQPPQEIDWNQRRRIPVRVFPNPLDFVRPDVVEADPSLRWLRDEYNRIARDSTIPQIPADLLGDLELPAIDWSISPDEALDHVSERGSTREGEGSREGDLDIPGLDTKLEPIQRKPFPVELLNNIIQNHPLLRVLQGITFDASGSGSCQVGSGVFTIDFCNHGWVLNLMGAIIVPIAFLVGLLGWRND